MLAIGVDIGGTKIAAGVVDTHGTVLARTSTSTSTSTHDPTEIEDRVTALVAQLRSELPADMVGVAAAGYVSHDGSSVLFAPTSPGATTHCGIDSPGQSTSRWSSRTMRTRPAGPSSGSAPVAAPRRW